MEFSCAFVLSLTVWYFVCVVCSYALVEVKINNEGDDGFKREIYGDSIIIERRITVSTSSTVLKDQYGINLFYVL